MPVEADRWYSCPTAYMIAANQTDQNLYLLAAAQKLGIIKVQHTNVQTMRYIKVVNLPQLD